MFRQLSLTAIILLGACNAEQSTLEPHLSPAQTVYDFDGVFDDTDAGTIDRERKARRPDGPPNIVLIIADDLGWPYYGFLGDENVMTPNLDLLGNHGTVFELGHATSNYCRPTLQSLISGLYPLQYEAQMSAIADQKLKNSPVAEADTPRAQAALRNEYETSAIAEIETLPRRLADIGYVSHQSGKWWEQSYKDGGFTHGMTGRSEWKDMLALGDRSFFSFMGGEGMKIGRETMEPVTDFIEEHADQPFFVWYGPALPHTPLNPPYKYYKHYQDREGFSESAKLYYANIAWFDDGVGQLLDSLEANGVLDNTLIVYFNDNGWEQDPSVEYADNPINFANGGPRGKTSFFETAFRTPVMFYWADQIAAKRDQTTLASAVDIVPTLLDYAGAPPIEGLPGYSLRPAIEGQSLEAARDAFIGKLTRHRAGTNFRGEADATTKDFMGSNLSGYYLRDRQWYFVEVDGTGETALYDMVADPGQKEDLSSNHPDLIARFRSEINEWRSKYEER